VTDPKDLEGFIRSGSPEGQLLRKLDFSRLPSHIAIIMDGNGRWARQRKLPRVSGHRAGIESVREVVECSARLGLGVLTLYAFSVENWKRPRAEVSTLMALLKEYLNKELATLQKNNIVFRTIGRIEELDPSVQRELRQAEAATAANTGLLFNIALSYSGRAEIVDACRALVRQARCGDLEPDQVDEDLFARHLYTRSQPDPDLLIRTSGELRISNFLLWQIAYAEIWVTETLWPDFRRGELLQAIIDYQKRRRRYGGLEREDEPGAPAPARLPAQRILV
jgi:undecaprenyl diphosphate synthase